MSDTPITTLHAFRCARCDAIVVSRAPPQIVTGRKNKRAVDHLACIECANHIVNAIGAEQRTPEPRDVAPSGPFFAAPLDHLGDNSS
jgi:hypothetical protein